MLTEDVVLQVVKLEPRKPAVCFSDGQETTTAGIHVEQCCCSADRVELQLMCPVGNDTLEET